MTSCPGEIGTFVPRSSKDDDDVPTTSQKTGEMLENAKIFSFADLPDVQQRHWQFLELFLWMVYKNVFKKECTF